MAEKHINQALDGTQQKYFHDDMWREVYAQQEIELNVRGFFSGGRGGDQR
jgi:hypothetical protein